MAAGKDIQYIFLEAQHRWLRPAEICEVLLNHQSLNIALEPPNKPPSGSLFLFNRKLLRGFRKDGHNWCKNKHGKASKEGHETLKAGGTDVLHCYYAHREENESFQRRSYWMLDEAYKHIALVHYLKVKKVRARGYKVRKHYKKIFMSVGIVEVILRWRRKRSGFRWFRHEAVNMATRTEPSKEDDYDIMRKGQKERWQRALVRVNSMVQFRRLLTIVRDFQETKVMDDLSCSGEAGAYGEDDLISMLLPDDLYPPQPFFWLEFNQTQPWRAIQEY